MTKPHKKKGTAGQDQGEDVLWKILAGQSAAILTWAATSRSASSSGSTESSQSLARGFHFLVGDVVVAVGDDGEGDGDGDGCSGSPQNGIVCGILSHHSLIISHHSRIISHNSRIISHHASGLLVMRTYACAGYEPVPSLEAIQKKMFAQSVDTLLL